MTVSSPIIKGSLPIPPESVEIETAVSAIRLWSCGLLAKSLGPSSKYDAVNGGVNYPLAFFVIPYDSYRTLLSDNVASMTSEQDVRL
jgi:hypothetical protein